EPSTPFKELFYNVNLYTVLIIGAPLYGVVTTYLFNREYVENTIKNILTIPVSRVSFIMSKTLLLFMWIMMLTMIAWFRSEERRVGKDCSDDGRLSELDDKRR